MTRQCCTKSARQKLELIAQSIGELAHAKDFCLRGDQLQSKRHPIETSADFGGELRLTIGQREPANGLGNTFDE